MIVRGKSSGATRGMRVRSYCWALLAVACAGRDVSRSAESTDKGGAPSNGAPTSAGSGAVDAGPTAGRGGGYFDGGLAGTGGTGNSSSEGLGGGANCFRYQSTDACRAAGCFAWTGTFWTRSGEIAGGSGGEGGAPTESCSISASVFVACRPDGSAGAVGIGPQCDAECKTCTGGIPYLVGDWGHASECNWACEDGVVTPKDGRSW